jgi:hypothetical protein
MRREARAPIATPGLVGLLTRAIDCDVSEQLHVSIVAGQLCNPFNAAAGNLWVRRTSGKRGCCGTLKAELYPRLDIDKEMGNKYGGFLDSSHSY